MSVLWKSCGSTRPNSALVKCPATRKSPSCPWWASGCAPTPASPAKCFEALAKEGINIRMISTSEIKISVVVDEKYLELGVRALHEAFEFELDKCRLKRMAGMDCLQRRTVENRKMMTWCY
jgi:hypothetical protein